MWILHSINNGHSPIKMHIYNCLQIWCHDLYMDWTPEGNKDQQVTCCMCVDSTFCRRGLCRAALHKVWAMSFCGQPWALCEKLPLWRLLLRRWPRVSVRSCSQLCSRLRSQGSASQLEGTGILWYISFCLFKCHTTYFLQKCSLVFHLIFQYKYFILKLRYIYLRREDAMSCFLKNT